MVEEINLSKVIWTYWNIFQLCCPKLLERGSTWCLTRQAGCFTWTGGNTMYEMYVPAKGWSKTWIGTSTRSSICQGCLVHLLKLILKPFTHILCFYSELESGCDELLPFTSFHNRVKLGQNIYVTRHRTSLEPASQRFCFTWTLLNHGHNCCLVCRMQELRVNCIFLVVKSWICWCSGVLLCAFVHGESGTNLKRLLCILKMHLSQYF